MKIAILGAGSVGQSLGGSLVGAGHQVTFAGRDAAKVAEAATAVGATAAGSAAEAAAAAEVVIIAVPHGAAAGVAHEIASVSAGKVVIDATNPLKADYSGLTTGDGPSAAEQLGALLPGARMVKAFNTIMASNQGNPAAHGLTLDALYATDDAGARTTFASLATSIGFRPVCVGPLAAARELESMAWLIIRLQLISNGAWNSAYVMVAPPEAATAG